MALHLIAETPLSDSRYWALLGLLMLTVLVGFGIIMSVRNRLLKDDLPSQPQSFTLRDLKTMRDNGELTEAEYQAAYQKMVARVKASAAGVDSKKPPGQV